MYIGHPGRLVINQPVSPEPVVNLQLGHLYSNNSLLAASQSHIRREVLQSRDDNRLSSDTKLGIALGVILGVIVATLFPVSALYLYRYQSSRHLNRRLLPQSHGWRYRHRRDSTRTALVINQSRVEPVRVRGSLGTRGRTGRPGRGGEPGRTGGLEREGRDGRRAVLRIPSLFEGAYGAGGSARGGGIRVNRGDFENASGGSGTGGHGQGGSGGDGGTGGGGGDGGDGGKGGTGKAHAEAHASVYSLLMCCFSTPPPKPQNEIHVAPMPPPWIAEGPHRPPSPPIRPDDEVHFGPLELEVGGPGPGGAQGEGIQLIVAGGTGLGGIGNGGHGGHGGLGGHGGEGGRGGIGGTGEASAKGFFN